MFGSLLRATGLDALGLFLRPLSDDIYKTYINPRATGRQVLLVSRLAVLSFGLLAGVFCIILLQIGININWWVAGAVMLVTAPVVLVGAELCHKNIVGHWRRLHPSTRRRHSSFACTDSPMSCDHDWCVQVVLRGGFAGGVGLSPNHLPHHLGPGPQGARPLHYYYWSKQTFSLALSQTVIRLACISCRSGRPSLRRWAASSAPSLRGSSLPKCGCAIGDLSAFQSALYLVCATLSRIANPPCCPSVIRLPLHEYANA